MNNSSPLIPQGSLLDQQNKGRARFKVAVLCVFGFQVLLFGGVLMLGCKRESSNTNQDALTSSGNNGSQETSLSSTPPPPPTNDAAMTPSNSTGLASAPPPMPMPPSTAVATPPPTAPPVPAMTPAQPAVTGSAQEYTLAKGDTYSSIGKKFGVTIKALVAANPTMPPTKLMPGKKIQIPAPAIASSTSSGATGAAAMDSADLYVVKSGDSLTAIASHHGTTVKALMAANSLKTTRIHPGEKLHLPAKASVPPAMPTAEATPATATSSSPVITGASASGPAMSAAPASIR